MIIDSLATPASQASGLKKGDQIVAINGKQTPYFDEVSSSLSENKGKTVNIEVVRNGKPETIPASVDKNGKLGVGVDQKALKLHYR
jgi:regulator of sigma E protease